MNNEIELERISSHADEEEQPNPSYGSDHDVSFQFLAPVDKGLAAWKMLLAAFVFESLLWGFPLSFGVFQNHYSLLPEFANQPYVSVIGTVASGITYMAAPIVIPMLKRLSKWRKHLIWCGWFMCMIGILASSFAQTVWALILTQGLLYGVGFAIFEYTIIDMVNEFWVARRGMAYGLICSASGVSGIVMPFSLDALLSKYGRSITLKAAVVALAVLTGPIIPFLKGRIPASQQAVTTKTDTGFLKVPLFWIYTLSNLMQGFGYFFPPLYLPSYASAIGLSTRTGAALLAIMSVSQVLGQFSFGYLSDRKLPLSILALVSTLTSAMAVFLLWGMAHSFAMLCVFALVYGFFGAGYVAMWARMGTAVTKDTTAAFTVFGLFNFGKGIGNVLSGPIGANLLEDSVRVKMYAAGKYETVVLFAGSCLLASAASIAFSYLRYLKPRYTNS